MSQVYTFDMSDLLNIVNLIIFALIVCFTLLTHLRGARLTLTAILSFFPASLIYLAIPSKDSLLLLGTKGAGLFYSHALIYGVLFMFVYFSVYKITQNEGLHFGVKKWINSILISVSFVLLLVALSFHILPSYDIFELGTKAQNFWTSNFGYLVSIIFPIIMVWKISRA